MANTVIQLKYSTVTNSPNSLNIGEPAYSYSSNTFFIGSPDSTGSISIGGKFYLDQQQNIYDLVNSSFNQANTNLNSVTAAFDHANSGFIQANTNLDSVTAAFIHANAAFEYANTIPIIDTYARDHVNSSFDQANTNASDITILQGVDVTQNTSISNLEGVNLTQNNDITAVQVKTNLAFNQANAAFDYANTAITTSGGTIIGSLNVSSNVFIGGNLTVQGTTTQVDSTTVKIADNILTLNAAVDQSSSPILDSGIEIDRGSSANVFIKWNESTDKWQFTNDGENYFDLGTEILAQASYNHGNAAFDSANTNASNITDILGINLTQNNNITNAQNTGNLAFLHANAAFDAANTIDVTAQVLPAFNQSNSSFIQANSAFDHVNAAYNEANSATTLAQDAYDYANTIDTFNQTLNTSDVVTFNTLESTNIANTIITGNLEINVINVSISGNLIPSQNVTYNIGSPDKRFHSIYVGPGSVDIGGIILSNNNGQLSVSGASQVAIGDTPLANADYFPIVRDFGFLEELNSSFGLGNDTFVFEVEAYDCREDPIRSFNIPLIRKDFGYLT